MQVYPRQKYCFPFVTPNGMAVWARTLCVLDDVEAFHQLLATENVTMSIDDNLTVSFKVSPLPSAFQYGPTYSRIVKKMWDTPSVRAVLDEFKIVAVNWYEQKRLPSDPINR